MEEYSALATGQHLHGVHSIWPDIAGEAPVRSVTAHEAIERAGANVVTGSSHHFEATLAGNARHALETVTVALRPGKAWSVPVASAE